ncbi:MAG: heparan-alpha-glucosaminide N-acetyltransferase [Methanoregula sp.]|nr:heparan-alpha-glucosaminide N-acetyltransferase [Methanoregula sp.]
MSGAERYPEIDLIRGIALVLMILFHTLFDLNFFSLFTIDLYTIFWRLYAYGGVSLFLVIVGVSLTISRARAGRYLDARGLATKFVLRGAKIICLGLLVTLATWWYLRDGYVIFGILSVIGVSVLCSPIFFRFGKKNVIIGIVCIAIGWIFATINGPIWLLPIGIHPAAFWSVDYTPIFPWLGVVLVGIALGDVLYPGGTRSFKLPTFPPTAIAPLTFMGRHSLAIYLVHQPIILAVLFVITGAPIL